MNNRIQVLLVLLCSSFISVCISAEDITCTVQMSEQAIAKLSVYATQFGQLLQKNQELLQQTQQRCAMYYTRYADIDWRTLTLGTIRRLHQDISLDLYRLEYGLELSATRTSYTQEELQILHTVKKVHALLDFLTLETLRATEIVALMLCPDCCCADELYLEEICDASQQYNDDMAAVVANCTEAQAALEQFQARFPDGVIINSTASFVALIEAVMTEVDQIITALRATELTEQEKELVDKQESLCSVLIVYVQHIVPLLHQLETTV